jgi:hypothetical protein
MELKPPASSGSVPNVKKMFVAFQCVKFSGKKMITCYHDNVIMITLS